MSFLLGTTIAAIYGPWIHGNISLLITANVCTAKIINFHLLKQISFLTESCC
jgi:hypothetical protein